MEMVTIEVRLPKEIYDKASEILARQGLTMEDALILFFQETARLGRIPFEYKAAHIRKDIPVRLTLRAFMIGEKKRSASPSPPYILTSEPLFRHHSHSCFRTDISIVRHASLTRWLRDS